MFLNATIGSKEGTTLYFLYNEKIYSQARGNLKSYKGNSSKGVEFVCVDAEAFSVKDEDNFYFFNPFSLEILQSVLGKILASYYDEARSMQLFFYYPLQIL